MYLHLADGDTTYRELEGGADFREQNNKLHFGYANSVWLWDILEAADMELELTRLWEMETLHKGWCPG